MVDKEDTSGAFVPKDVDTEPFKKRLTQVETDLKGIESLDTRYARNVARREVWRDNELLLMDLEEAGVIEEGKMESEWQKKNLEIRRQLTIEPLSLEMNGPNKAFMFARALGMFIWCFGGLWILFLCSPLRWLHPALRRFGVPNDYLPIDLLVTVVANGLVRCSGAVPTVQGLETREYPPPQPYLTMFAHPSNLDPMVLLRTSPVIHKGVGKQSLFMIPVIGWAFRFAMGSIPLDRGSRKRAVAQLDRLKASMQRWRRCLTIAPEGTRQPQGQLQPFKKGAFHLQHDLGCPVAPVVHFGPFELWPRNRMMNAPGHVTIRYMPLVYPDKGADHNQVRRQVRRLMLEESCKDVPKDAGTTLTDSETRSVHFSIALTVVLGLIELWITYVVTSIAFGSWSLLSLCMFVSSCFVALEFAVYFGLNLPTSGQIVDKLTGHDAAATILMK
ncbi:hypothetical protein SARC_01970 [Sphaeroforma arctica JP610]|uniref:Phospholipid/glycerol acyltransferase domain-containing protein n=1 Tax=Sphaeroforma arctica JP610 TaxID=667725 RepID=A0A0L0GAF0_9EUKA|nr:hypothetical protein SARC_01970 [Sphaeroforma arctica JP610]KNC85861.1 hypothetical protein SARC_01970 [Sphaeroforma arctica JP610]|eukprot:XP_014159763.1 hypothetical protein SARC_01970 [Sphaeroforma arctica JP610]